MAATQGPGLIGALLVGLSSAKAIAAAQGASVRPRRPPPGARGGELRALRRRPLRAPVRVPDRQRRTHAAGARGRPRRLRGDRDARSTTPPARPSTRAPACSASATPGARRSSGWRGGGDPQAFSFPGSPGRAPAGTLSAARAAFAEGLDFSFAGVKTALLYKLRELSEQERERAGRRPRRLLPGGDRREPPVAHRTGPARAGASAWRSAGAWRPTASCAGAWASSTSSCTCPSAPLCTDNAAMIASAARFGEQLAYPRYLALDAYASGERPLETGDGARDGLLQARLPPLRARRCRRCGALQPELAFELQERDITRPGRPPPRLFRADPGRSRSTARSCANTLSTRPCCASV